MSEKLRGWGVPDSHLVDEEAAFIADNLDILFTTEEMNRYILPHHTKKGKVVVHMQLN